MKKLLTLAIIRHLLTFLGGLAAAKGYGDNDLTVEIAGIVVAAVGGIWSAIAKFNDRHAAQFSASTGELHPRFVSPKPTKGGSRGLLSLLLLSVFCFVLFVFCFVCPAQTFRSAPAQLRQYGTDGKTLLPPVPAADSAETNRATIRDGLLEIGEAMLNSVSNITFIPGVRIPLDGGNISYLLAGVYPVTDNVVLGGRLDFASVGEGYSIYGGSISCTLQAERKVFGVTTVGFVSQAVEFPLSGRTFGGFTVPGTPSNEDPFPLTSAGISFKVYRHEWGNRSLTVGLLAAYETGWREGTKSIIAAPTLNYRW